MSTRLASTAFVLLIFTAIVMAAAPGPPGSLAAAVNGNTVTLSWQAPSTGGAPTGYVVEAALSPGGIAIAAVPVAQTALDVPHVPAGVYYVRVRAVNADGPGPVSSEVIVVVPGGGGGCAFPPGPPANVSGTASGNLVSLQWTAPVGGCAATAYVVHAGSASGLSDIAVVNVGATFSLAASAPNGTYHVRIVALNAFGGSAPSSEAIVTVGGGPPGSTPLLTFTVTPNPVPFTGVFPGCAGSPIASRTWIYTLRIANQGAGPFNLASFSNRVSSPLLPVPVDTPVPREQFALVFGASTIPPQSALQGQLCVFGNFDDATLVWTFVDVGGAAFNSPVIQFLRSPF